MNTLVKSLAASVALALSLTFTPGCSNNEKPAETKTSTVQTPSGEPMEVKVTVKRGTSEGTPTMVKTVVATAQVRVSDINYDARQITLAAPDGNDEIFDVDPAVVNFNQIHKGDMVNAKFTQKLAISVSKEGNEPDVVIAGQVELPPEGSKPSINASRTAQITATVTAIDKENRVVSVTGPRGNTLTFQVAPQAKGLENVNVGDQVVARYTEAVEIWVSGS
jgi:hypothetical protein